MEEKTEDVKAELELLEELLEEVGNAWRMRRTRTVATLVYQILEAGCRAVLATVGLEPSSHKAVRSMIAEHFVRTGALPFYVTRDLASLFELRQVALYGGRMARYLTVEDVQAEIFKLWRSLRFVLKLPEIVKLSQDISEKALSIRHLLDRFTGEVFGVSEKQLEAWFSTGIAPEPAQKSNRKNSELHVSDGISDNPVPSSTNRSGPTGTLAPGG